MFPSTYYAVRTIALFPFPISVVWPPFALGSFCYLRSPYADRPTDRSSSGLHTTYSSDVRPYGCLSFARSDGEGEEEELLSLIFLPPSPLPPSVADGPSDVTNGFVRTNNMLI